MLEVCVDSLESARSAIFNGADELEVCSCLPQGGLTPSVGLVKQVLNMVNKYMTAPTEDDEEFLKPVLPDKRPKVNVMIRCRAGADFCYSNMEMDTMLDDIDMFKSLGVDRFVFGGLTDIQQIDDVHCIKILAQAYPTPVTFHRAFDVCEDPVNALAEIIHLGFDRVLTSGQKSHAADPEAIVLIKKLVELYGDKIEIMPGAGINIDNVNTFIDLGCTIVHSSCKVSKPLVKIEDDLGIGDMQHIYVTDGNIVRKIKEIIICS